MLRVGQFIFPTDCSHMPHPIYPHLTFTQPTHTPVTRATPCPFPIPCPLPAHLYPAPRLHFDPVYHRRVPRVAQIIRHAIRLRTYALAAMMIRPERAMNRMMDVGGRRSVLATRLSIYLSSFHLFFHLPRTAPAPARLRYVVGTSLWLYLLRTCITMPRSATLAAYTPAPSHLHRPTVFDHGCIGTLHARGRVWAM